MRCRPRTPPPAQSWASITGKPSTFTPAAHTHAVADVTGLQAALDGKQPAGSYAPTSHVHTIANVTGLQAALDGKQAAGSYAPATHVHAIADVTGLQAALDTAAAPQTLSLTGSNLSLSGGGGTVTLPSGAGGGGTGWTPAAGRAFGAAQVITGGAYEWTILQYDAPTEPVVDLTWNATSNGWVINTAGWYECRYLFRRPDNNPVGGISMWIGTQTNPDFGHLTAAWAGETTTASIARNSFTHHVAIYATPGQLIRTAIAFDGGPTNRSGGAFFIYRVA